MIQLTRVEAQVLLMVCEDIKAMLGGVFLLRYQPGRKEDHNSMVNRAAFGEKLLKEKLVLAKAADIIGELAKNV